MITITDAIRSLATGASYTIVDDQINWFSPDITQPTQAEIDAEILRLQAEQDATQYQRDRQAEYPSIDELIVALWEGVVEERMASVTALEGLRQAVKTKYPKP
jgi:hypothetical protein